MDKKEERVIWIDIVKGISILLVVFGHMGLTNVPYLGPWINFFHVPVFFIISGIIFSSSESIWEFLRKKYFYLIRPYLYFSFIVGVCLYLSKSMNLEDIKRLIIYGWKGIALWFIPVLLFTQLIWFWIYNYCNQCVRRCILILCVLFAYFSSKNIGYTPYNLLLIPISIVYFAIGYLGKKKWITISGQYSNRKLIYLAVIFFLFSCIGFVNEKQTVVYAFNNLGYVLPSLISGLSGSFLICTWSIFFFRLTKPNNPTVRLFSFIGKNTYIILAFHQLFLTFSVLYIRPFIMNYCLYKLVELLAIGLGCYLLILLINKHVPFIIRENKAAKQ